MTGPFQLAGWLIGLSICAFASAGDGMGDWAHVRGPGYAGHANPAGIRLPWSAAGPTILWRKRVGDGYSGLVVADGRLYSQVQTLAGQWVVCLEVATGRELWRTRLNWPWGSDGKWPGPYASPTCSGGRVYCADCYGVVACIDGRDGRRLWSVDLARDLGAELPGFGYACTPLVESGKVFLPAGGDDRAVVALDAETGSLLWRSGSASASYSSCVMLRVQDRAQVVVYLEHLALALDPNTGLELWRYPWSGEYNPHGTWPLYQEPYLFYGLPFRRGAHALKLTRSADGVSAETVWTSDVLSMDIMSGVIVDGFIYGFGLQDFQTRSAGGTEGLFKCVELATGRERWSSPAPGCAHVLACGDKLLMLSESGSLIATQADPTVFRELARWPLFSGRTCWTAPALCGDTLVARSHDEFVAVFLGDPARLGTRPAPGTLIALHPWERFSGWFASHYGSAFHAPTWSEQAGWYLACLLGVFLPAGFVSVVLFKPGWRAQLAFVLISILLSFGATWWLTTALGRFIFTWPATVFVLFFVVVLCRAWARSAPDRTRLLVARLALGGLAIASVGYWHLCRSLFLVAGSGFLVGLLPALPFTVRAASRALDPKSQGRACAVGLLAFTVHFWASVVFLWWRTNR